MGNWTRSFSDPVQRVLDPVHRVAARGGLADILLFGALLVLVMAALIVVGMFLAEAGAVLSTRVLHLSTADMF